MPSDRERLLIKVILPKQGTERKQEGGGGSPEPFRTVNAAYRQSLSIRLGAIKTVVQQQASEIGAAPMRVKLIKEALAKSHRPDSIFGNETCPIIGSGSLGELFVKATADGLEKLDRMVLRNTTKQVVKELSTIETLEPITPQFRRKGFDSTNIISHSPKKDGAYVTKVQLFDFGGDQQTRVVENFLNKCRMATVVAARRGYSSESPYFEVLCKNTADVEAISNIVSVRSIKEMPVMNTISRQGLRDMPRPANLPLPAGEPNAHPIVVVVDSGVSDQIPELSPWIIGRTSNVAPQYQDPRHGTFVAGLICWGRELNPSLTSLDSEPCMVYDLQVLPNQDPDRGDISSLTETELLQDLETALATHANDFKVWNLSLGSDEICSLDEFSSFAVELDRLQEKYNVSFVISAGNYSKLPMLSYPRSGQQLAEGRITTPADSVLGITVGSVAHHSHQPNGPKKNEPSAFSRHGAGPNYIIKPDLVHYGGCCACDSSEVRGVRSLDLTGTSEGIGTSYSAPLVSRLLANIYHEVTPSPSPVLARAILTHNASHPGTGSRVPDEEENFFGFGLPKGIGTALECAPWNSTLIFEDQLRDGYYLEWDDFPYPDCLRANGKFYGQIAMTLAFSPSRGASWGAEYCETHIEANFGVYQRRRSRDTGAVTLQFKGLVPPEHKNPGVLYESYQVEKLRKWAPVRTYFGDLGEGGVRGERWRLKVRLLCRHGIEDKAAFNPQRFALLVTISDPTQAGPVYDQMAVKIRSRFSSANLNLRTPVRVQTQGAV